MVSEAPPASPPHAALLLIGDELLSGKVRDENGYFLAKVLRRRGIRLLEVATVGDDPEVIGATLLRLCARAPLVFTSGGLGPTHDDRTLAAIAAAIGVPLERNEAMERELRQHFGTHLNDVALRMADLPRGTKLRALPGWPVLRLDLEQPTARVYILPGVPGLLRAKVERLETLAGELPLGDPWHLRLVHTTMDESHLAPLLDALLETYPGLEIGSYPRWTRDADGHVRGHVRITLEAPSSRSAMVDEACQALLSGLPPDKLVDEEASSRAD